MFFHMGKDIMVDSKDIIVILDYKKFKKSPHSQNFLINSKKKGLIDDQGMHNKDVKTIIITKNKTLLSPIAPSTIEKRMKKISFNRG